MDEADVKSEQFGQERGAQALPKQFVVEIFIWREEDGGFASVCVSCREYRESRHTGRQAGRQAGSTHAQRRAWIS